jgi:hypothetical protein
VDHAQIDSRTVEGTNKAYLQSIIDTYGIDSDIAKVRVLGQFPSASSMQFIGTGWSQAAREREIVESAILPSDPVIFGSTMLASAMTDTCLRSGRAGMRARGRGSGGRARTRCRLRATFTR